VTANTHVLIILPIAHSTSGPESCGPSPQRFTTPSTPHYLPLPFFCLHPSQPPATTAVAFSRCTCYPAAAASNPPPPLQLAAAALPLPSSEQNGLGVAGVHRSPKRQWRRWGGGCGGGGAGHGATGTKAWPLPTTSRRNDINTDGAVEGGREGKKEDTGQGAESGAEIGVRKAKTAKSSAEWVGGGGESGWATGGRVQGGRGGPARVAVVTECNARIRAYREGADWWRWGLQDERPRVVRSAKEGRCVEESSSPQERLGRQQRWIRPPRNLIHDWSNVSGGSSCGTDPRPDWTHSS